MKNYFTLFFLLFSAINMCAQSGFFVSGGTILGGAINNEKISNAKGEPLFGVSVDFGNLIAIREKFNYIPKIGFEYRNFNYSATERKDTLVGSVVAGNDVLIPTYYNASVKGKVNSLGITLNNSVEYKIWKNSYLLGGVYSTFFIYKNDYIDINVKIGEGGLLPDIDSTYNNGVNMRKFEIGFKMGGKYKINDRLSLSIIGTRAISDLYKISAVKNENGDEIKLYSTYAKIFMSYYF